jgi:GTP-binding protein EngB required for normal cell division
MTLIAVAGSKEKSFAELKSIEELKASTPSAFESVYEFSDTPSREPLVIAVMGCTGAGKSSFIQRVTGCKDIEVGHSLNSSKYIATVANFFRVKLSRSQ